MLEILPLQSEFLQPAAALFVRGYQKQRQAVPILPATMEDLELVAGKLGILSMHRSGLVAIEKGQLVGYLGWITSNNFRGPGRKGVFSPVWAHAVTAPPDDGAKTGRFTGEDRRIEKPESSVYQALYRAASVVWTEEKCIAHAISLLAVDHMALRTWFWNGFGLALIDAIRPVQPLGIVTNESLAIRKANPDDAEIIAALDAEHWRHYTQPPILMAAHEAGDASANREFLSEPLNSIWLASLAGEPVGFIRFEGQSFGATDIVRSETTIAITGAFVRPGFRGLGAAPALLDAALRDYGARGFERCAVDFESFNPEATGFWLKYFEPVCLSVIRHPEAYL